MLYIDRIIVFLNDVRNIILTNDLGVLGNVGLDEDHFTGAVRLVDRGDDLLACGFVYVDYANFLKISIRFFIVTFLNLLIVRSPIIV